MFEAITICPWKAYQCAQTLCICQIWMQEAVWVGCQPQPWLNETPKSDPNSVGITVDYCHMPMNSISMFSKTMYLSNVDEWEADWVGCQPQPWCNDIMLTPQVNQNPKIWAKKCGYDSLRLLPYAHGQHIYMLKHVVYIKCGCRMQFYLAVSLKHDLMTSFWLHKWPRTPNSDPTIEGITIWGYCHMPMDSISMCSRTFVCV